MSPQSPTISSSPSSSMTSSTASPTPNTSVAVHQHGLSGGAIAGIVIGAVSLTTLAICGLFYFFKISRKPRATTSNVLHAGPRANRSQSHRTVDSMSSYSAGEAGKNEPYKAKTLRENEYGYGYGFGYYGKSADADDKSIAETSVGGDTLVSNHDHELAHTASLPYAYPPRSPYSSSPTPFHSSPLSPTFYPPPPVERQTSREDYDQQLSPSRKRTVRKPVPKYLNDSDAPRTPVLDTEVAPPSPTPFYSGSQQRQVPLDSHPVDRTAPSSSLAIAPDGTPVRININDLPQLSHKSSFGNGRQLHYFIPDMPPPQSR